MKKNSNSIELEFKKGLTEEEINSPEFDPDDFAPAPDEVQSSNENEGLENKRNALSFAFIVALFALIIGLVGWGTTAAVNAYSDNVEKNNALSMFENCDRVEKYEADKEGYTVYAVFFKDKMAGYCVFDTTEGFGGNIELIVAFNSNNMISNIKIIEHNESMGLGSKIAGDSFLSQFKGLLIGNVDAKYDLISGATTSSKAVGESIKAILGLGLSTDSIAKELGYETITEEEIEEEIKKEEDNKKDPSDITDPSDTTGSSKPNVGDLEGGANVNQGDGDMNLDGRDETTEYETETTEHEEDTTSPEETTKKPEDTTVPPEDTTGEPEDSETEADTTTPDTTASEETTAPDTAVQDTTAVPDDGSDTSNGEDAGVVDAALDDN